MRNLFTCELHSQTLSRLGRPRAAGVHVSNLSVCYFIAFLINSIVFASLRSSDRLDVMAGSTHWNGGTRISVERTVVHPDYDRRRFLNDIALLKLSSSPSSIHAEVGGGPFYSNPSHLESFSAPSSPLSSSYSDHKNIFDVPASLFPSSSSSQSLSQLSSLSSMGTDPNFPNLPLDSKTSDDPSASLLQSDSHNSIWEENTADESDPNAFFKRKKSKADWFFDSQIVDDKDDEMNNRLNENFKKNTVSEYFKIRARSNVESTAESSAVQQTNNETAVSGKKSADGADALSKLGGKERFRNEPEFEADAIKLPEYFMQFKGTATVVGWGLISESDRVGTDHLMAANVRILENDECKNYKNFEEDTQICAGYSNGGVDAW